jgi:predicted RNA-binding protein YlxR (DUF448 family)
MRLAWDGQVVQVSRTASGRGAWLHPTAACVQGAQKKGVLSRAFRTAVPVDAIDTAVLDEFVEKSL